MFSNVKSQVAFLIKWKFLQITLLTLFDFSCKSIMAIKINGSRRFSQYLEAPKKCWLPISLHKFVSFHNLQCWGFVDFSSSNFTKFTIPYLKQINIPEDAKLHIEHALSVKNWAESLWSGPAVTENICCTKEIGLSPLSYCILLPETDIMGERYFMGLMHFILCYSLHEPINNWNKQKDRQSFLITLLPIKSLLNTKVQ